MKRLVFWIHSESEDGTKAEQIKISGKWSLIWWLITNQFDKGVYLNRYKIEINLKKTKPQK